MLGEIRGVFDKWRKAELDVQIIREIQRGHDLVEIQVKQNHAQGGVHEVGRDGDAGRQIVGLVNADHFQMGLAVVQCFLNVGRCAQQQTHGVAAVDEKSPAVIQQVKLAVFVLIGFLQQWQEIRSPSHGVSQPGPDTGRTG